MTQSAGRPFWVSACGDPVENSVVPEDNQKKSADNPVHCRKFLDPRTCGCFSDVQLAESATHRPVKRA